MGDHLLDSYNEAFDEGKMSISQRRGIISLIPKGKSYVVELTNWRPIALLNVDYKILARAIANRIMGQTLLVKALGISKIVYSASTLCVPEEFIKRVQEKLFSFLWQNKKDKKKKSRTCIISKTMWRRSKLSEC